MDRHGYDHILVFVDRFSKQPVSIPCHNTIDAKETARLFLAHVYRHKGAPETVVSDRGPQFVSEYWTEFCRLIQTQLKLSTAHHAQTDGQTEIVNQAIINRLRIFVNFFQDNWSELMPMMDFAASCLPHESASLTPFYINNGFEPRTSFDWTTSSISPLRSPQQQEAHDQIQRLQQVWDLVHGNLYSAQLRQTEQANRHRRPVDFQPGDYVWLSLKPYRTQRPSKKLDDQMAGPFRVLRSVGHAFELDLPSSMQIHPIFSPDKLRKAAMDPLPGQANEAPPPINIQGEDEWLVENIIASKMSRGRLFYRVKWEGYDHDPVWYPASNFRGSPHKIQSFHHEYPNQPGPPRRLDVWLRYWNTDQPLDDHPDDDRSTA